MKNDITLNGASKGDCRDIWLWRNHPEVRKRFFNEKPVSWEEHEKWFYSKIKDRNAKIYIARQGKDKIGVIRFEADKHSVRVSVNLNPQFFGKSLGSAIIRLGTDKLLSETKKDIPIIAEIKSTNIVSQKAFSKAGYKYDKETEDKLVYKR